MSTRSAIETAKRIIYVLPDDEHLLRPQLMSFVESTFLELPECNGHLWQQLQTILNMHIVYRDGNMPDWWPEVSEIALGHR